MLGETARLVTQLDLKDGLTGGLNRASQAVRGFSNASNQNLARMNQGVGKVAAGIGRIATVAAATTLGAGVAITKWTADFGDRLNIINTIAQTTPDKLAAIGEGIKDLSADTGADLSDLTDGYYDLLSAGVKVKDAQDSLTLAYKLSRGALSTTAEAVDFLTTAQNAYGLSSQQTAKAADMIAQAVADGKVKLSEIAATFADVAPVAAQYGIGIDEIAASYGSLTAKGNTAGATVTQMNRAIIELAKPSGPLALLEKSTGKSYIALAGKEGLVNALAEMGRDARKAGIDIAQLYGRQEALKFALQLTGQNARKFREELERIRDSGGAVSRQYDERQKGLAYQFQRLAANIKVAGIAVGEGFAPALGRIADKLSAFLKENRKELVDFGKSIGQALDGIDWGAVKTGAQTLLDILRGGYEIVRLIPPQIDAVVLGFIGLNKLSGGLLGGGLRDIFGGLVGGITGAIGRGVAGKLPGLGSFIAQPVYVVNWPVGGLGGGAAGAVAPSGVGRVMGAVRVLGAVSIAGASIAALGEAFGQFQQQIGQSQARLQAQANAAANQPAVDALRNIQRYTAHLSGLQGLDRILADTFGGQQEAEALANLSRALVSNGTLTTDQLRQAIEAAKRAQVEANARGSTKVSQSIGQDIAILQARLTSQLSGVNAELDRIRGKDTSVTVHTTVNTSVSTRDVDTRTQMTRRYGMQAI